MNKAFAPAHIAQLQLRNRLFRSATNEGMANPDGTPTPALEKLYLRMAEGGVGAIITGYTGVMPAGRTFNNMAMFTTDAQAAAYGRINEALRPKGTRLIVQLAHGGSKANAEVTGMDVISPVTLKRNAYGQPCREATEAEIHEIIRAFVSAVVRAKAAGIDGVQIHAAHGYLLSEFISPTINKRTDDWGGSTEGRVRILTEVLRQSRAAVGQYPILVKLSASDEYKDGLSEEEALRIGSMIEANGADAIEVSCGYGDFMHTIRMPKPPVEAVVHLIPEAPDQPGLMYFKKIMARLLGSTMLKPHEPQSNYNVPLARRMRSVLGIPVIAVGGIRKRADIEEIVERGGVDFVAMSRPFIIEPDIVEKFQSGRQEESKCINCGYCLFGPISVGLKCYYGKVPKGKA